MLVQQLLSFGALFLASTTASIPSSDKQVILGSSTSSAVSDIIDTTASVDLPVTEILQASLTTIAEFKQQPACKRNAAHALAQTCATLKATDVEGQYGYLASTDTMLETERSLFALRTSVCDLQRDGFDIPQRCDAFQQVVSAGKKRWFSWPANDASSQPVERDPAYEEATAAQRLACLAGLRDESNGQGWITYQLSFNQAGAICQALRHNVEREEDLEVLRAFVNITGDHTKIFAATKSQMQGLLKAWTELQVSARQYVVDLWQDTAHAQSEVMAHVKAELAAYSAQLTTNLREAADEASGLKESVRTANQDVQGLLHNTSTGLAMLIKTQSQDIQQAGEHAVTTIKDLLQFFVESVGQQAIQMTGKHDQQLQLRHNQSMERMDQMDDRLDSTNQSITAIAAQAVNAAETINKTMADLKQVFHDVRSLLDIFTDNVLPFLRSTGTFIASASVYAAMCFAFWRRLLGFSLVLDIAFSLSAGFVLACLTIRYLSITAVVTLITTYQHTIMLICFSIGALTTGLMLVGRAWHNRRDRRGRDDAEERWLHERGLPATEQLPTANFSLPVNNPRYMAERQAGGKRW